MSFGTYAQFRIISAIDDSYLNNMITGNNNLGTTGDSLIWSTDSSYVTVDGQTAKGTFYSD